MDDAPEVRVDLPAEIFFRDFLECTGETVTGIVDDDIDTTELIERFGDGELRLFGRTHVELYGMDAMAVLHDEFVELLRLARGGDDPVPGFEGGGDESAAKTA
jgi:hypothetical protein